MIDFSRIGKECGELFHEAALESFRLGLPNDSWDDEKGCVVQTWPDGRVEFVEGINPPNDKPA